MNCKLCNQKRENTINLLGVNICKGCFNTITHIPISHKKYDYYKELIKEILKEYMCQRTNLDPVE
ncbi:sigma factor G inhibitor Gin [Tepidimicrobium xylanilyticum]|uniref:Inhibitor of sigma-G Gin n=1 Tax=Tepidimicrobium xylanilyticum TaxID=1123352 RepID=A0A1H2WLP9_9FIRM|nr:sigma factor G inhibitor Gin [Tepidimicrobium xylanilyticum]GMG95205.1 hypothetical protein EN5CB1_00310 [Tepidimicrobium xylanilyticum]SDW81552.1 Inhibitor of sigma-G Gin [Tepidimicrobium xylanilyticum]